MSARSGFDRAIDVGGSLLQVFFALLMLASAGGKLLDMRGFYGIVESYRMLPVEIIPLSAWLLTLFELVMGFLLLDKRSATFASALLIPLHLFYLVGLSQALWRGLQLPNCGCFGVYWGRPLTSTSIVEDVVLLVMALLLWRWLKKT